MGLNVEQEEGRVSARVSASHHKHGHDLGTLHVDIWEIESIEIMGLDFHPNSQIQLLYQYMQTVSWGQRGVYVKWQ